MSFSLPALRICTVTFVLAALSIATTRAATITWGAAANLSADSNVNNAGITVVAFRLGQTGLTAATCNGVTFQPFAFPTTEQPNTYSLTNCNVTIMPGGNMTSNTGFGTTSGAYGQLPAATQNLLQSGLFSDLNQITLTIGGLVPGVSYTFEYWGNNAGNFTSYGYQITRAYSGTTATGTYGQTIANTSTPLGTSTLGSVGQFITGTFTADATSQSIFFKSSNDSALLNAFQLRTAAIAPEPSTWACFAAGAGLLGVAALRRRRAARAV